ncbi:predicted protein [Phaeodactylum tricornutum CCAP 1055/1]|uniref:Uncharacterized protein n=2 Tax=Phaeodactylum tricornutum TaxID=2850 RepID=B7G9V5_PHATC|nr:predicted protein [Phaeodactylum tricornutum CCAP 1055/1]EEC44627.1 predicted protein [Phaeodactylum tricornutum CCAP 1055/1]|eukprot:XP_002183958.1 predicted protein [Phaeodactylum tricornutum CCAP 1055/1]
MDAERFQQFPVVSHAFWRLPSTRVAPAGYTDMPSMSEGEQPTGLDGVTKRRCGRLNKKPLDEDNDQSTATTTGNESRPGLQPREAKVDQDACLVQEVVEIQPDPIADKKSSVKGGLYFANIETNPTLSKITGEPRSGIGAHLTPTKKRRKNKNGIGYN